MSDFVLRKYQIRHISFYKIFFKLAKFLVKSVIESFSMIFYFKRKYLEAIALNHEQWIILEIYYDIM